MKPSIFSDILQCPTCRGDMSATASEIRCTACSHSCPVIGGIPWIYQHPEAQIAEWRGRYNFFLQSLQHEAELLKSDLKSVNLLPLTAQRLRRMQQAKVEHGKAVKKLLEPLGSGTEGSLELSIAAKTKLPENQRLMSYYPNIFRDWSWGTDENERSLLSLLKVVGQEFQPDSLLVFGAGACRLAADLHTKLKPRLSLALDINPFLFAVAKKMLNGQSLSLYEFPIAPRNTEAVAVAQKCHRPEGALHDGFHLALADALTPPIKARSFDAALTPWFIDIVPQDFKKTARQVNRTLKTGGMWLNFGSLAFFHQRQSLCYSRDEVHAIVESSGFRITAVTEDRIPYLHSPLSTQERFESVYCFAAEKVDDVDEPSPFHFLPDWLRDFDHSVPQLPEFARLIVVNRLYADIVSLVDGQKSISELGAAIAPALGLSPDSARAVICSLLTNIYESSLRGTQF